MTTYIESHMFFKEPITGLLKFKMAEIR